MRRLAAAAASSGDDELMDGGVDAAEDQLRALARAAAGSPEPDAEDMERSVAGAARQQEELRIVFTELKTVFVLVSSGKWLIL